MATAVVAVIAAGPLDFFPSGNPSIIHGQYVETNHGSTVGILTKARYEHLNMRIVRFAGLISTFMLIIIAPVLSGALEIEKRRSDPKT